MHIYNFFSPSCPKTLVDPTYGADSSHTLVQTVVAYPQSLLFSGDTISVVQVISIARRELIDIFDAIDVNINKTTLSDGVAKKNLKQGTFYDAINFLTTVWNKMNCQ